MNSPIRARDDTTANKSSMITGYNNEEETVYIIWNKEESIAIFYYHSLN
jgi:hypothetical protein